MMMIVFGLTSIFHIKIYQKTYLHNQLAFKVTLTTNRDNCPSSEAAAEFNKNNKDMSA